MAADVAEFLRKKFLTDFDEAKKTELSPANPLLLHLDKTKQVVEEISVLYPSSSSATLVRLQPPLYLVNNVLAECRIFEFQWNEPNKSLVRFNFFTKLYFNYRMKSQLRASQRKLESILIQDKQNATIQMPFTTAQRYPSTSTSVVNDSEIFGFDGHAQCIENLLLGDKTSDGFIAAGIVGMGGTGKNTLVGKVLSSPEICKEFFPRIQISLSAILSGEGDTRRIIALQLLRELNYNDLDESLGSLELLEVLKKQLLGKKYLIVLNDVWDKNEWYENLDSGQPEGEIFEDLLSHGLPKGSGGAVIVTSRLEHVARSMVGSKNLFRLKPCLHWSDSSKILTKHINEDRMGKDKYNMFLKIKCEVEDQCHDLPLAAEIIARFISSGGKASHVGEAWAAVEKRFDQLTSNTRAMLPRSLFSACVDMGQSSEFAEELFDMLAQRRQDINRDWISKDQLEEFWEKISELNSKNSLHIFFDLIDEDGDGQVNVAEVAKIISLCASANRLTNIKMQAEEYAALIMEELDPYNVGYITIDNLERLQPQEPSELPMGDSRYLYRMLRQKLRRTDDTNPSKLPMEDSSYLSRMLSEKLRPSYDTNPLKKLYPAMWYLSDNWQRVWVIALWIGLMSGLFSYKYVQYRHRVAAYQVMGDCVCMAKGAAETLKLNMALVLLPICRNTITWLRNKTKLGGVVPFDDTINFHMVIAIGIAIGVGIHGVVYLACIFPRLLHASSDKYELMEPFFGKGQPRSYWHFVKSVEGVTGIIMVVLMAIAFTLAAPCFRRGRINLPKPLGKLIGFNSFWYSHHFFVFVYALLIAHGNYLHLTQEWYNKTTWMYLAVPLVLYGYERLIRALRSCIKTVKIIKVAFYPGNVLALHTSKPQGFRYKSGQYMLIKCAAISSFEWHPFYMTSSPGDDYLSVHIRTIGDWTKKLESVFSQACRPPQNGNGGENNPGIPKILIDGPYGAPTQDYKNYEVVLLVGLGIGVAPIISIVKDIVNNAMAMEKEENALEIESGVATPNMKIKTVDFKTRRAYMYWVAREQGSFNWFKNVMNEVAELDHMGVVEMHNYCTSVYEEGDARSSLIAMLQSINHAKTGVDVVSGTRVKSHFARPNWHKVYKKIAVRHINSRVGVFYCGAPSLTKELKHLASDFSHKTSTKFDFHKEHFMI